VNGFSKDTIGADVASNGSSCIENIPTRITKFINNRGAML